MTTLYVVKTNAVPGREAEFDRWYDEIHLPEVLALEGFRAAQRFRLAAMQVQSEQAHGWLALYEIDDDVETVLANLRSATHLQQTDALDVGSVDVSVFVALGPRRVSA